MLWMQGLWVIMNVIGVGRCSIRDRSKSCPPDLAGLSTVMFGTLRRPRGFAIVSKDSDSDCAERSVLESDPPANPHLKRTEMWGTQIGGQMWATRLLMILRNCETWNFKKVVG